MAKTVTQIQTLVRFYGTDDSISLTADPGLSILNSIYDSIVAAFPWPEFRKSLDSADATATGTNKYAWIATSAAVFTDVRAVEVGTTATDATFNLLYVPPTELAWNEVRSAANTIPVYYQRISEGGANKIELRPAPNYTGGTIRVTGIVEPTALTVAGSTTEFLQSSADDALAHIVAASFAMRDGIAQNAQTNIQKATQILQTLFRNEKITAEEVRDIAAAG